MAATKRKPAPKKSNAKSKRVVVSKPSKYSPRNFSLRTKLLFVGLFALMGGAAIYASFADTPTDIVVGMGSAGAVSASRDTAGGVTVSGSGAALSFQITNDNVLQCTNNAAGKITTAQLTPQQTSDIANQVIAAGIQTQADSVVASGQGTLESTWVRVNASGVSKTVNITGTVESTDFGRAVSAVARDACKQANKPLNTQASAGTTDKKISKSQAQALAQKLEDALNAKAYADGYGPLRETGNYVSLNYWRDANGVSLNLKATACLRDSARKHSEDMANYNTMSHQLPNEPYFGKRIDNQCGSGNWTYAGENVGWNSDMSLNGVAKLVDIMAQEKAPDNGHRLNILSTHYTNVGAGVYLDYTHNKVWITQDFAAFNNAEPAYDTADGWNLNGSATVSSSTAGAAATIYAKPGQAVYYHYRIANTGPKRASYTQYRIWKNYSATGALVSSSDEHAETSNTTGWGRHGDGWPASTTEYAFSGRYYDDYTYDTAATVIPSTAKNGEKYCRAIWYNNAAGPSTGAETSNYACAIVKS